MGATFEGQTKDTDGQVWAEAEVEGVSSEVSTRFMSDRDYRTDMWMNE